MEQQMVHDTVATDAGRVAVSQARDDFSASCQKMLADIENLQKTYQADAANSFYQVLNETVPVLKKMAATIDTYANFLNWSNNTMMSADEEGSRVAGGIRL